MALLTGHGEAKYLTGACLGSSRALGWSSLLAERWRHAQGDLGELVPRETEVIVNLGGRLRVRRRGGRGRVQNHIAVEGTVWLCPAGVPEDMIRLYGDIRESVHMYLPAQPLARAALEELDLDPASVALDYAGGFRDPVIESIGRAIAYEMTRDDPLGRLLVDTMSSALGVYLFRNYSNRSPALAPTTALANDRVARVVNYIDAHVSAELSLAELAREACMSPFHFARCFKAATGLAPHAYVLRRRVEKARALLEVGAMSLAEIASICGFCSQAHFTNAFTRAVGRSPGFYRGARR
jgi:AraC family transcriptional regulator